MRILQVCPVTFRTVGGGYAEYVRNISVRLARRGHEVTVFGSNPRSRFPRFEVIDGVRVERFRHFSWNNAYYFSLELPLRLRQVEFDVVHGHGFQSFPMHFSTLAKRRKLVTSPHFHGESYSLFRDSLLKLFKPFGRRTLLKADAVVAVSEYEKSLIHREFRIDGSKIHVVPNGVDFGEFNGIRRRERGFRSILYVGRLEAYKGVQHLVRVLPRLEDVVLEIVGKGPMREALERQAGRLGVLDRVFFFQDLPRRELLQKYADASVFALLSEFEAYSLAVAEALTAGTPCIVAKATALTEWIDNTNCFGININIDLTDLARLITEIIGNGVTVDQRTIKKDKISGWDEVIARLETIYGN